MEGQRTYIAIDLKSFYASVECVERKLNPLTTNLVVADTSRTEKTICLAVSPSLKACGIPGRPRLFEVVQKARQVNGARLNRAIQGRSIRRGENGKYEFAAKSFDAIALEADPSLELTYIVAKPQMRRYEEISAKIYGIYLKYIAPEDIIVYSIDEVFMDVTAYLKTYRMTAHELAMTMIREVLYTTGITATAGIGTNLYLCKVAMDIVAKHSLPDQNGVRIAELDEMSYRRILWGHRPLTDFWRVGKGYAKKLEANGLTTMGDIARCSTTEYGESRLYKLFGINAELLIDHAWGWEPCTIDVIKQYRPETKSISSGQVLTRPYKYDEAELVVKEMTDMLALDLVDKRLVCDQVMLTIGYDRESLTNDGKQYTVTGQPYTGGLVKDGYGRTIPKHAHGTEHLPRPTSSARLIMEAMLKLYKNVVDRNLLIRRINVVADHIILEAQAAEAAPQAEQMDLFIDYAALEQRRQAEAETLEKERRMQEALLRIKKRFGKNAILKGISLQEGATARERNQQIGGHKA